MKKNALNIIMLIISVLIITLSLVFKEHLVSFLTYLLFVLDAFQDEYSLKQNPNKNMPDVVF